MSEAARLPVPSQDFPVLCAHGLDQDLVSRLVQRAISDVRKEGWLASLVRDLSSLELAMANASARFTEAATTIGTVYDPGALGLVVRAVNDRLGGPARRDGVDLLNATTKLAALCERYDREIAIKRGLDEARQLDGGETTGELAKYAGPAIAAAMVTHQQATASMLVEVLPRLAPDDRHAIARALRDGEHTLAELSVRKRTDAAERTALALARFVKMSPAIRHALAEAPVEAEAPKRRRSAS